MLVIKINAGLNDRDFNIKAISLKGNKLNKLSFIIHVWGEQIIVLQYVFKGTLTRALAMLIFWLKLLNY